MSHIQGNETSSSSDGSNFQRSEEIVPARMNPDHTAGGAPGSGDAVSTKHPVRSSATPWGRAGRTRSARWAGKVSLVMAASMENREDLGEATSSPSVAAPRSTARTNADRTVGGAPESRDAVSSLDTHQPSPAQIPSAQVVVENQKEATVDASQKPTSAVTEASACDAPGITSVREPGGSNVTAVPGNNTPPMDAQGYEAIVPPTLGAQGKGRSNVGAFATPEIYPPTPREGPSDNAGAHAKDRKERKVANVSAASLPEEAPVEEPGERQGRVDESRAGARAKDRKERKVAKTSMAHLPSWPEEVPIEDPCERQVHVDESRVLRTEKKRRNRATEDVATDENEIQSQASDSPASAAEMQNAPDIFEEEPPSDQRLGIAPRATPGAVAIPGFDSDDDDNNNEQLGNETSPGMASDIESVSDSSEETSQAIVGARVVDERGQGTGNARNNAADERMRDHLLANALLVSATAVQDSPENPDAAPVAKRCSPRDHSRHTCAMLGLLLVISVAAATLMGVFIPRGSTADAQEGAPSSIPTTSPSLPPSLTPTSDPETLRFRSIQSILVTVSGLEALSNSSTPQYRALEWLSLVDPRQLPFNTKAERKRVIQRYVLAVLYYAWGGEHWLHNYYFLKDIHECDWHTIAKPNEWGFTTEGAFCTKGREVGEVDHLYINDNNLTSTLPSELQYLTHLEGLLIARNKKLGGPIPGFVGNMTSLEELTLFDNRMTGAISESLGNLANLKTLYLHQNMLTGTIPSALGRLSSLEVLGLGRNRLTGAIPESFGTLSSLEQLYLYGNMLNGSIPSALGQLSSLNMLILHVDRLILNENFFTGKIPIELCRRRESGDLTLWVDSLTANGTELLCECIPVGGHSGCCVVRPEALGDKRCDDDYEPYNTAACGWDGGDCLVEGLPECLGVNPSRIGNDFCDVQEPYNTEACGYDGGNCCESTCEGLKCGWKGYDCKDPTVDITCLDAEGLEGCCVEFPSQLGDGYCHPYKAYYTEACKYDNGDCPVSCPEGTSPVAGQNMSACCVKNPGSFVGDGWCDDDDNHNTAACGWDGGDCCKETCEDGGYFDCGANGFDCKDPSYNQHQ